MTAPAAQRCLSNMVGFIASSPRISAPCTDRSPQGEEPSRLICTPWALLREKECDRRHLVNCSYMRVFLFWVTCSDKTCQ